MQTMNNSINRDVPFRFHWNTPASFKSHNTIIPSKFQQYSGRFNMTCLSNSHSSLALLIAKTTDMSEALGAVPPANQSALGHTQMAPKCPHSRELQNARILQKVTSFRSWKTTSFSVNILSPFWHHGCQIWWFMEVPNLKYLTKKRIFFEIFHFFRIGLNRFTVVSPLIYL